MSNLASKLIVELVEAAKGGNESQIDDASRSMVVLSRTQAIDLLRRLEALPMHLAFSGVAASAQKSLSDQVGELSTYIPVPPSPTISTVEQSSFLEVEDKVEPPPFLTEKVEPVPPTEPTQTEPMPVLVQSSSGITCSACGCIMQRATVEELGNKPSYHKCINDNFYL